MLQLRTQPLSRAWLRFPPHLRLCLESLSGPAGRRHLGRHASTCDKELKGKSCREEMPGCAWRLQQSGVLGPSETQSHCVRGKRTRDRQKPWWFCSCPWQGLSAVSLCPWCQHPSLLGRSKEAVRLSQVCGSEGEGLRASLELLPALARWKEPGQGRPD